MTHIVATYQILFSHLQPGEASIRIGKDKRPKVEMRLRLRAYQRLLKAWLFFRTAATGLAQLLG